MCNIPLLTLNFFASKLKANNGGYKNIEVYDGFLTETS